MNSKDIKEITEAIDRLAEAYATDKNGQFDLNAYIAFKAGFDKGFDICLQLLNSGKQQQTQ